VLASALGAPIVVLANAKLPPSVTIANAKIECHFRVGFYDAVARRMAATGRADVGGWRALRDRWRYRLATRSHGEIYHGDLVRFLAERDIDACDHLIVHSADDLITRPLTLLLSERPRRKMPTLHFRHLGLSDKANLDPVDHGTLDELIEQGRAFLYAEMDVVRQKMQAAFAGARVDMLRLALPTEYTQGDRVDRVRSGREFSVLYFGDLRNDKGWQRVPDIVRLLSSVGSNFRITMHVGNPWVLARRRNRTVRRAIDATGIEVLPGHVSDRDLAHVLSNADVVILPYRPQSYRFRGSGVGLDCIAHGVPMIVSADCALGEFVIDGNGLEARSDDDFVAAIVRIRKDYASFAAGAERAQRASKSWLADSLLPKRIAGVPG
jgi:glycosyltransferase involved in cell wall biosynthesis